jgi:hypothetical protein
MIKEMHWQLAPKYVETFILLVEDRRINFTHFHEDIRILIKLNAKTASDTVEF